jgi:hypothetical protein
VGMWESHVLRAISKSVWEPVCGLHRDVISIALFHTVAGVGSPCDVEDTKPRTRRRSSFLRRDPRPSIFRFARAASAIRRPLTTIMVVVGPVLLIAGANIANLLLARAIARRHELNPDVMPAALVRFALHDVNNPLQGGHAGERCNSSTARIRQGSGTMCGFVG